MFCSGNSARLRKFATASAFQRMGIGTRMLAYVLGVSAENNLTHFWCDARESAICFYERFGMAPEGDRFFKGDVPYFKMSVSLA